jgi:hypothetical protein
VTEVSPNSSLLSQDHLDGMVEAKVSKLNLRQIVDVSAQLGMISASIKLKDIHMTANVENTAYYDAIFRLAILKVPSIPETPNEPEPMKKGNR